MSVITLNKNNFDNEVINSDKTVLIDFWASWCGPCRMMSPVIDQIAEEMGDNIKVGKINIDEERDLAIQYDVMSIPTFIVFKGGKEIDRSIGVQDKEEIKSMLK